MPTDDTADPDLPIDPDAPGSSNSDRRWDIALVIAAGGAIGGLARYGLNVAWPHQTSMFPWSTFTENVLGCLVLGALMVYLLDVRPISRYARPFLAVGVLGGFTTFSTFTADIRVLVIEGEVPLALLYVVASLVIGLLGTWLGLTLARRVAGIAPPGATV